MAGTGAEGAMIPDPAADARTRLPERVAVPWMLLGPALLVVLLLFGGGLAWGVVQSLGYLPSAGMDAPTLDHFRNVLTDRDFFRSLGLTLYISLVSTAISAGIGLGMALLLSGATGRGRILHFVFQIPLVAPHLVVAVAVAFLLAPAGLIGRALASLGLISGTGDFPLLINDPWAIGILIVYVWKEVPFIALMLLSVLQRGGRERMEVARTLKAGPWQRFRYVVVPTVFPSLGAACLIVFAYTFGAFEVPFLLGRTYPMTLPVQAYRYYSDVDLLSRPEGIATGLVIAATVVLTLVLGQGIVRSARRRGATI
jgi:putative spermidine/putrescine transport system permease protein